MATGRLLHTLHGHTGNVNDLAFSPDGATLISAGWDGTIRCWDVRTGACRQILHTEPPYAAMNITGATGLTEVQQAALRALGAVEHDPAMRADRQEIVRPGSSA